MTTAVLGSSSGIAGGPSGLSGGPSGADCGCGCTCTGGPCVCCKPSNCIVITGTGAIDSGSFYIPCAVDGIYSFYSMETTIDGCCWNYIYSNYEPPSYTSSDHAAIVKIYYSNTTGQYSSSLTVYYPDGCVLVYSSTTPDISCSGGMLSGTITFSTTVLQDGTVVSVCTGTAVLTTSSDCGDCWREIFTCGGFDTITNTYMTCLDAEKVGGNSFKLPMDSRCLYPSPIGQTSIPSGATVISGGLPTGNCDDCVGTCYVQARRCTSCFGGGPGELVNIWFLCGDVPGGDAFGDGGDDCFHILRDTVFVPGIGVSGLPDGSKALGGTLYSGSDFMPQNNCMTCSGVTCPFGTGDCETSWLDGPGGGVSACGLNPTYTLSFFCVVTGWSEDHCTGISTDICSSAASGTITASLAPCRWQSASIDVGACGSGIVTLSISGGKWVVNISVSLYGGGTSTLQACLPTGNYPGGSYCSSGSGYSVVISGVTVT